MAPRSLFKNYGGGPSRQRSKLSDDAEMEQATNEYLEEMQNNSQYFLKNAPRSVPMLHVSEVFLENTIGMGEFGTVVEVTGIQLQNRVDKGSRIKTISSSIVGTSNKNIQLPLQQASPSSRASISRNSKSCLELSTLNNMENEPMNDDPTKAKESPNIQLSLRSQLAATVSPRGAMTSNHYNYAVKQIRKDLYPAKRIEAAKSLAREQQFLRTIQHPNIIRLRGIVGKPGFTNHMMILDKLEHSLLQQIVNWKDQLQAPSFSFPWQSQQTEKTVLSQRLLALYDIAQAIKFLHSELILFRDLKTENVAKNPRTDAMQLFDFGLAKELKASEKVGSDTYRLTGLTGTLRIMAPEVIQCVPYGVQADIYSFAIVVWEVFGGDRNQLSAVEVCKGERPSCPVPGMSASFEANLLQPSWRENPDQRPTISQVCAEILSQILNGRSRDFDSSIITNRVELLRKFSKENIAEMVA